MDRNVLDFFSLQQLNPQYLQNRESQNVFVTKYVQYSGPVLNEKDNCEMYVAGMPLSTRMHKKMVADFKFCTVCKANRTHAKSLI
jgi:hypothetical protein